LINAPRGSVVLDSNVSTLMGRLLSCFDWTKRPKAVTSDLEFPSAEFVMRAFERYGCRPVVVTSKNGASIDDEGICAAIDEDTQLVMISHATFATGAVSDVRAIARRARAVGALVAVDAYQTIGTMAVDVQALDADVVFGGSHKWLCGAFDCAFAYVRPDVLATLEPAATGWMASSDPLSFARASGWASDARRFTAGTPALLPAITSGDGLRLLGAVGIDVIRKLSLARTDRIIAMADEAGLEVVTPRAHSRRGGVVSLRFGSSAEVVAALKRAGFVCSHRGGARIAPHYYNTDEEVESFMRALVNARRDPAAFGANGHPS
jgi:kynureninase